MHHGASLAVRSTFQTASLNLDYLPGHDQMQMHSTRLFQAMQVRPDLPVPVLWH